MSKLDAQRAMREARYAERTTRTSTRSAAPTAPTASTPGAKPAKRAAAKKPPADRAVPTGTDEALCGHRAISGRTCTREQGHAAKSHRYS